MQWLWNNLQQLWNSLQHLWNIYRSFEAAIKQFTAVNVMKQFVKQFTAFMKHCYQTSYSIYKAVYSCYATVYSIYDTVHMIQSTVRLFDGTWYVLVVFMWEEVKLSKENNPCLTSWHYMMYIQITYRACLLNHRITNLVAFAIAYSIRNLVFKMLQCLWISINKYNLGHDMKNKSMVSVTSDRFVHAIVLA